MLIFAAVNVNFSNNKKLIIMEQKRQGRIVNADTLGKDQMTREERKALYDSMPSGNKYVEAAKRLQGSIVILDPAILN